ncbi:hypothetical protein KUCAC02_027838 [Chaenocephalus aceratus]|nr:hypothetical protein KUCAC02_027838 [Chaenocephalus aceratus]
MKACSEKPAGPAGDGCLRKTRNIKTLLTYGGSAVPERTERPAVDVLSLERALWSAVAQVGLISESRSERGASKWTEQSMLGKEPQSTYQL